MSRIGLRRPSRADEREPMIGDNITSLATVPITVVDAFTTEPFRGNPAAICFLDEPAPEPWMRAVAREMNLSETAYLVPARDPAASRWSLRWFTPEVEIDLCGHATLASAHVLAERGALPPGTTARFDTRSGELTARRDADRIVLDFPATPATATALPDGLLGALGLADDEVEAAGRNDAYVVLQIGDPTRVEALAPDFGALRAVDVRAVVVTARGRANGPDITSRVFGPAVGIDEDPVTGSAHCLLAPWWADQLGRTVLQAHQASPRGGDMEVRLVGDRVELVGSAVTVWRGDILAPDAGQP
jgi:PhzF family phenazine biosynthesis protein